MQVHFWGVRGSIPAPPNSQHLLSKIRRVLELSAGKDLSSPQKIDAFLNSLSERELGFLGGNTPCVEVRVDNKIIVFDMGSGFRELGDYLIQKQKMSGKDIEIHVFICHTHWDHIQGFPFFVPAYRANTTIHFYHVHPNFKERLEQQQDFRFFPVSMNNMASKKEFIQVQSGAGVRIGEVVIKNIELNHPGKSYSFRVEHEGKTFVYASDGEYNNLPTSKIKDYINFFKDADLLVFDAPYSFSEEIEKINWGHSSALIGVDLSVKANIKLLSLFHHAPENDDEAVFKLLDTAKHYQLQNYPKSKLQIILAREGLTIAL
jgi:phosphoribosyl 1,2-cyclic phosphodiesterase